MTVADSTRFRMNDEEFSRDPYPTYEKMRSACPVTHVDEYFEEYGDGGYWFATTYDDVVNILKDWRRYSSADHKVLSIPAMVPRDFAMLPQDADPPEHARYRSLVSPVFQRGRVEALYDGFRTSGAALLDAAVGDESVDVVTAITQTFSLYCLADFMGLPRDETDQWRAWVEQLLMGHQDPVAADEGRVAFMAYVDALIDEREAMPRDDFISMLLESEVEGTTLDRSELRGFILLVLIAGHDTTSSAMSTTLAYFADHPEALDGLRAKPGLILTAVEELLRYSSPIQAFARVATIDHALGGAEIKQGDVVAVSYGSANRDESMFECPHEVRLDRQPNRHLAFGMGPHTCVGAHVARLEMRVLLELLVESVDRIEPLPERPRDWKLRGDKRMLDHFWARLVPRGGS